MSLSRLLQLAAVPLLTTTTTTHAFEDIPTVDMSMPAEESARILYDAATTFGFFYVVNHGVSKSTTTRLLSMSHQLFDLPLESKLPYHHNTTHWGYVPFQDERTDPSGQLLHADTKEGFYFQNNLSPADFLHLSHVSSDTTNKNKKKHVQRLPKQNQWPSDSLFNCVEPNFSNSSDSAKTRKQPKHSKKLKTTYDTIIDQTVSTSSAAKKIEISSAFGQNFETSFQKFGQNSENNQLFSEVVSEYLSEMYDLSNRILETVALSFNLSRNYFTDFDNEQPLSREEFLRRHDQNAKDLLYLLHYPKGMKSNAEGGKYGTGEHTDYSLFTILLTDHQPGLEIFNEVEKKWVRLLDNIGDSFVVNIADTLELWTNNVFRSAKHRVILDGKDDRYSVPYFVHSNYDNIIGCLPGTVKDGEECGHAEFRAGDYLHDKLEKSHATLKGSELERKNV